MAKKFEIRNNPAELQIFRIEGKGVHNHMNQL